MKTDFEEQLEELNDYFEDDSSGKELDFENNIYEEEEE